MSTTTSTTSPTGSCPTWAARSSARSKGCGHLRRCPARDKAASDFALSCAACGLPDGGLDLGELADRMFMIMLQDFMDPWTFNQKNLMKCCKEFLLPGGKQIPFCAYNSVGYREQARDQLYARERARIRARREGRVFEPAPLTFSFPAASRSQPLELRSVESPTETSRSNQQPARSSSVVRTSMPATGCAC